MSTQPDQRTYKKGDWIWYLAGGKGRRIYTEIKDVQGTQAIKVGVPGGPQRWIPTSWVDNEAGVK